MSHKAIDPAAVVAYMARMKEEYPDTKVYIGTDSSRYKVKGVWYADYTLVLCVHIGARHGCKVFAEIQTEKDYDANASRPFSRMMNEAKKAVEMHERFKDILQDFEVYIHLDINPKESAGSNVAASAALGYVKGCTNVTPILKPMALAASFAADRAQDLAIAV